MPPLKPRSFRTKKSRAHGFTLVELCVSVIIIAALFVLLLSGVDRANESARSAKCMTQMRQIATAMLAWSAENNGVIYPSVKSDGNGWTLPIAQYMGLKDRLRCPTYVQKYGTQWAPATGYGMSRYLASSNAVAGSAVNYDNRAKLSQIAAPNRTPILYEMDNQLASEAWGGYPRDGGAKSSYCFYPAHRDGFNLVFFDGHSQWVKFNKGGTYKGEAAADYPDFVWKPF